MLKIKIQEEQPLGELFKLLETSLKVERPPSRIVINLSPIACMQLVNLNKHGALFLKPSVDHNLSLLADNLKLEKSQLASLLIYEGMKKVL